MTMNFLKRLFKKNKWVTVTSVKQVETDDFKYMEIYENNKTSVIVF